VPSLPPPSPTTLLEALHHRAQADAALPAFTFEDRPHSYADLWLGVTRFAAGLAGRGVRPRERVVLALPNGPAFFHALYGTQQAGAIPVPVFPRSGPARIRRLEELSGAALTVADRETFDQISHRGTDQTAASSPSPARPTEEISPDHPALIQYTSGSTGEPKGVVITHANLLTNIGQMIAGMEITERDVFVSWLPVHHDMGLVLMTMVPFFLGARLVLLPSDLTDVRVWLRAIDEHRGTFTAAPDFAYRVCLWAVRDPSRFDLTSLRVALNAAEPVRSTTIRRFEGAFGLDRVMVAGYGLAEATVGVSMQPPGTAPILSEREPQGEGDGRLVAIGTPFPGVRVEIVDPEHPDRRVEANEVGEIVVESPASTSGYFRDPEATAALFWRPGAPRGIRTGDLGFRDAEGNVFIVGRAKNVILQAGRNLAPQEIEEAVEGLPFVRRAAAVGVDRGRAEGEQAYVFAELRKAKPPSDDRLHEMATEVVARVHDHLGLRPGRVLLLAPRTIPLTPNGKLRHPALRAAFLDGTLRASGAILFPER